MTTNFNLLISSNSSPNSSLTSSTNSSVSEKTDELRQMLAKNRLNFWINIKKLIILWIKTMISKHLILILMNAN
jgi:hypothetical protein